MHIHCKNEDWAVSQLTPRAITLRSSQPLANRWHHLRIRVPVTGSHTFKAQVVLRRNLHGNASRLLPGRRPGDLELVFFHAPKLQSLQLEFPADLVLASHLIDLEISECRSPYAITRMLGSVIRSDWKAGTDPTRIFRKSVKRLLLHGRERFVSKLIRDYHPQEAERYHAGNAYAAWIHANETLAFPDQASVDAAIAALDARPLVSIIIPTSTAQPHRLREAIESVRRQSYPHWELWLATEPEVSSVLDEFGSDDARVHISRDRNPVVASNGALQLATGDYVTLLDADDQLAEHALYWVAHAIARHPAPQLIYGDDDRIDEQGCRQDPHFKPDWNPDLLYSQNYVSRLAAYPRVLLHRIGGFRAEPGEAADYDLLLRCLSEIQPEQITHIPKVLYHRRTTATDNAPDPNHAHAALDALRKHFASQGKAGIAVETGLAPGLYRVRYPVPSPPPLVSLIIPTRDKLDLLERCVRSILSKTTYRHYEILILDNESAEADALAFFSRIQAEEPRVRVLPYHHPFNYSAINNFGASHVRGEIIGLVNNDVEVITPDWLTEMVSHACRPEIGCVGAKLYYDDDTIQHAGVILGLWGVAGHAHKRFPHNAEGYHKRALSVQNFSAVTAACLLVRKQIYNLVGGLNATALPVSFNDVDFCLKVRRAGYRNLWTPYAELYHHESVSRGADDTPEKKARERRETEYMTATWCAELAHDPYYSPNLTRRREDFSVDTNSSRPQAA